RSRPRRTAEHPRVSDERRGYTASMEARLEAWRRLRDQVERVGPAFTPPDAETMAYLRSAFALPSWFERMLLEVGYPERALEGHFFPPLEQVRRYVASLDDWD